MKIIGLTGGIGSGKSTVARFLEELGATLLDTDKIGHDAMKPGSEGWQRVVAAFGKEILTADGEIDRARLGKLVFNDNAARTRLNDILHPLIFSMTDARLEELRRNNVAVAVLEIPLMAETGRRHGADEVWVTVAPEATVITRLGDRTGLSEDEARARIRSQVSSEERARHADAVIDTDCNLAELKERVTALWRDFRARHPADSVDT